MITADNLMTFKMVVKTIAKRHGLHATFMPKPKSETYGSGMHINLSLYKNDGTNAFITQRMRTDSARKDIILLVA